MNLFALLPPADAAAICKLAEEKAHSRLDGLRPIAQGFLGTAVGTAAGIGLAHAANKLYTKSQGHQIPIPYLMAAVPTLGAGLGLAYSLARAHQQREIERSLTSPDQKPSE